jgi:peptide-methionine (S)-S-oxide reductase
MTATPPTPPTASGSETIVLGGGCFWCTEAVFVRVRGILDVESGYCNGHVRQPTYEQVCSGDTGHAEVVKLVFDPAAISLSQIFAIFFATHDPTTLNRQGHDVGTQYRSGIYFTTPGQEVAAQAFIAQLTEQRLFGSPIVTEVAALDNYSPAEDYHQDFFENHPTQGYCVAVAGPKVAKLRKVFADLVKD